MAITINTEAERRFWEGCVMAFVQSYPMEESGSRFTSRVCEWKVGATKGATSFADTMLAALRERDGVAAHHRGHPPAVEPPTPGSRPR